MVVKPRLLMARSTAPIFSSAASESSSYTVASPVKRQEARSPAIGNPKSIEVIEHARKRDSGKAQNRHGPKMAAADRRRQSASQRLVAQKCIEIGRDLGNADRMPLGRDTGMQV